MAELEFFLFRQYFSISGKVLLEWLDIFRILRIPIRFFWVFSKVLRCFLPSSACVRRRCQNFEDSNQIFLGL